MANIPLADPERLVVMARDLGELLWAQTPAQIARRATHLLETLVAHLHVPSPWTTDCPTQPGWYAFKHAHEGDSPKMVEIHVGNHNELRADWWPLDRYAEGQWKGPLDFDAL